MYTDLLYYYKHENNVQSKKLDIVFLAAFCLNQYMKCKNHTPRFMYYMKADVYTIMVQL